MYNTMGSQDLDLYSLSKDMTDPFLDITSEGEINLFQKLYGKKDQILLLYINNLLMKNIIGLFRIYSRRAFNYNININNNK